MLYLMNDHTYPSSLFDTWYPAMRKPTSVFGGFFPLSPYWADHFSSTPFLGSIANTMMSVHFDKNTNTYIVEAPTPGAKREEIKLEVVGRRKLEVNIEQRAKDDQGTKEGEENDKAVVRKFFAGVTLPEDADTTNGKVEYADGLLRVFFPKAEEGDNKLQIALEGENAALATEVSSRLNKIKELRAQLEAEVGEAAKAEAKLREARVEAQRKIASECMALTLS